MTARIERLITSGTFSLDGETFEVENNVWIVGDSSEVIVVDPAHSASAVLEAVGDRKVQAIICTHGHDDHITGVKEVREKTGASSYLHPEDRILWDMHYPDEAPDEQLTHGQTFEVAGTQLQIRHTPGHSPGAVSIYIPELNTVISGDTLFKGGPGATGRSFSDFPTIIESIKRELFLLPEDTAVLTGHGDSTTIGAEKPSLDEWIARGH